MPSNRECAKILRKAAGEDVLSNEQAEKMISEIKELAENKRKDKLLSERVALEEAAELYLGKHDFDMMAEKRNQVLNFTKRREGIKRIRSFESPFGGLASLISNEVGKLGGQAGVRDGKWSVETVFDGVFTDHIDEAHGGLERHPGLVDRFYSGEMDADVEVEMEQLTLPDGKPGITGNADAKLVAEIYHPVMDRLLNRKNRAGAHIGKIKGYTVPQQWEGHYIRDLGGKDHHATGHLEASYQAFKSLVWDELNHVETFGAKNSEETLRLIHKNLYYENHDHSKLILGEDGAVIDAVGSLPESNALVGNLAESLSAQRILHFKNAAARQRVREKIGRHQRLSDALDARIRQDSRAIALMEVLGPNATKTFQELYDFAARLAKEGGDSFKHSAPFKSPNERMWLMGKWRMVTGNAESGAHSPYTRVVEGVLMTQTLSKLSGVAITSMTDVPFSIAAISGDFGLGKLDSAMRILREMPKAFKAFAKFSKDGNAETLYYRQAKAAVDTVGSEALLRVGGDLLRGGGRSGDKMKRFAQAAFRITGLPQWTNMMKAVNHGVAASLIGEMRHLSFNRLPPELIRSLTEFGITSKEWDISRQLVMDIGDGDLRFAPELLDSVDVTPLVDGVVTDINISRVRDEFRTKWISWFTSLENRAVPTPGIREDVIRTGGGNAKNTILGATAPIVTQFKAFPITVVNKVMRQGMRNAEYHGSYKPHIMNMLFLVSATTLTGYMSGMFKDLIKGRTPKSLTKPKTWLDAAMRGGAAGIYGDILMQRYDRSINKFSTTLLGPTAGSIVDPAFAAVGQLLFDQDPAAAGKTVKNMIDQNVPKAGLAHLFVIKPVYDYLIGYQINEFFDPDWSDRMKKRLDENAGQSVFAHGDPDNRFME